MLAHSAKHYTVDRCRIGEPNLYSPTMPIIYTTGRAVDRSVSAGDSLFFAKPYRREDIVQACCDLRAKHSRRVCEPPKPAASAVC